jgi:hypothetical protein
LGPLDGTESLGIGGGSGQYILFIGYDDHNEFWNLEIPEHGEATVELTAGGQMGDYRAYQVVSFQLARRCWRTTNRARERRAFPGGSRSDQ